jgi:hypothetical protein
MRVLELGDGLHRLRPDLTARLFLHHGARVPLVREVDLFGPTKRIPNLFRTSSPGLARS